MLQELLKDHHVILASESPRRHAFFKELDIPFEVRLRPVEEVYPENLEGATISEYLAVLKASAFSKELQAKDILITSDTIVWHQSKALGKPADEAKAFEMLQSLSGKSHEVITSVCLTTTAKQLVFSDRTKVTFTDLEPSEIKYYIRTCKPFDKAGAYGIQEWIGSIGITKIEGSYNNVVGLPTSKLYETLKTFGKAD